MFHAVSPKTLFGMADLIINNFLLALSKVAPVLLLPVDVESLNVSMPSPPPRALSRRQLGFLLLHIVQIFPAG